MEGTIKTKKVLDDAGNWSVVNVYFLDSVEVTKEEFDTAFPEREGVPGGCPTKGWPLRSEALAVHPGQVSEANERNKRAGVATRYDPATGQAIIPSAREKAKLVKLEGFVDKQKGYI